MDGSIKRGLPWSMAMGLAFAAAASSALASGGDEPPSDPARDRQQYLEAEGRRAAVRDHPDYGRYDRADLNRSREAACRRWSDAPGARWLAGGYVGDRQRRLVPVRDGRGHGLPPPPRGARWMCADSGDLLLVVVSSGLIHDVVPAE